MVGSVWIFQRFGQQVVVHTLFILFVRDVWRMCHTKNTKNYHRQQMEQPLNFNGIPDIQAKHHSLESLQKSWHIQII